MEVQELIRELDPVGRCNWCDRVFEKRSLKKFKEDNQEIVFVCLDQTDCFDYRYGIRGYAGQGHHQRTRS